MTDHDHSHEYDKSSTKKLGWILLLTGGFMAVEFAAGLLTGSLALLADAGHMLRDSVGLVLAFIAARLAERPSDSVATYGYRRYEVLAAFLNSLLLFGLLVFILIDAIHRFLEPASINGLVVILVGTAGLAINLVGVVLLRADAESNINIRGAYLEVLADAFGSIGVIISGAVVLTTGWVYADAIVAVGIALWILPRTWALFRDAGRILLEATPPTTDIEKLAAELSKLEGVRRVHDLHVWSLTETSHLLSVHLETRSLSESAQIELIRSAQQIAREHDIEHSTIQIEPAEYSDEKLNLD